MLCPNCGSDSEKNIKFCTECGSVLMQEVEKAEAEVKSRVGYSALINDPAFARYMRNAKIWSFTFALIIAVAAIIGFFIYGETSSEMDNPEALYIGMGIGGMFLLIAVFQTIGRSRSKNWDGVVIDKKFEKKRRKRESGTYKLYTVVFQTDSGKVLERSVEDDDTLYNYYQIGDKVRHHKGLNSIEKYDKSGDSIIFCSACSSLNDINDDKCFRCSCPLLK
ncbi:MAG: hypothetical protein VB084_03980 [Syntrophomonadaceae bacterium]|nr:hypothetical protein [Syntrophomonadaceae bacterium]